MSEYISKYAVCPYYHRHDREQDSHKICCEGTDQHNTINLVYCDSKKLKEYEKTHCNSIEGCRKCLIHMALNIKYGV